jgi:hypothetical protein
MPSYQKLKYMKCIPFSPTYSCTPLIIEPRTLSNNSRYRTISQASITHGTFRIFIMTLNWWLFDTCLYSENINRNAITLDTKDFPTIFLVLECQIYLQKLYNYFWKIPYLWHTCFMYSEACNLPEKYHIPWIFTSQRKKLEYWNINSIIGWQESTENSC